MDERGARGGEDGPDGMQQSGRIHESKRMREVRELMGMGLMGCNRAEEYTSLYG